MKRKQARPAAQRAPRTHTRDQSEAATGLGTPGFNPEPREPLPLRQQEDLEPSTAEHTALALASNFNQTPLTSPVFTAVVTSGAVLRDPLRGDRNLRLPLPKIRASSVLASTLGISDLCACRTPSPSTDVPPSQRKHPPPPAPIPAQALAGEPESGDESPPLQGEAPMAPVQDPDAHTD
ncbi:hypothetical protein JEQ12_019064 [Ovis aries]|uniref:Uncharacterized protein n=1 Tax=Ovis aries TaxID=9940 RepID=A0A836A0R7_SHEEP|nr:hypothetical protein JEQ12_019064 [Ovis aries]